MIKNSLISKSISPEYNSVKSSENATTPINIFNTVNLKNVEVMPCNDLIKNVNHERNKNIVLDELIDDIA